MFIINNYAASRNACDARRVKHTLVSSVLFVLFQQPRELWLALPRQEVHVSTRTGSALHVNEVLCNTLCCCLFFLIPCRPLVWLTLSFPSQGNFRVLEIKQMSKDFVEGPHIILIFYFMPYLTPFSLLLASNNI